jgi:ABC-type glutathione transport system ATPase component
VKEIKRKFDEIVNFAELEQFIDTPIKRYSSGMAIRLGFAIATAVESDILIVDEVLAVGDIAFQRKCFDRIEDIIKRQGKTILLVSHNIRQVERLCTRTVLLDHGRILADGDTREVCHTFYERTNARVKATAVAMAAKHVASTRQAPDCELVTMQVIGADGASTDVVPYRRDLTVEIRFRTQAELSSVVFSLGLHTSDLLYLATHDSERQLSVERLRPGEYTVRCVFRRPPVVPGVYSLRLAIAENGGTTQLFYGENLLHFQISNSAGAEAPPTSPEGFFALDGEWMAPVPVGESALKLEAA